jgi:hypothetical protein
VRELLQAIANQIAPHVRSLPIGRGRRGP